MQLMPVIERPDGVISPIRFEDFGKARPAHSDRVTELAFAFWGQRLVSASADGRVWIWEFRQRSPRSEWRVGDAESIAVSRTGTLIARNDPEDPHIFRIRPTDAEDDLIAIDTSATGRVVRSEFSDDELRLVTGTVRGVVQIWDTATGTELLSIDAHDREILDLVYPYGGEWVASSSADKRLRI